MFGSTLSVAVILFLITSIPAQNLDSRTGHLHQPDTAPDLNLVPARRITPATTTAHYHHRHHHVDDFSLPIPTHHPHYNYEDDYATVTWVWDTTEIQESGDYDKMAAHTEKEELVKNEVLQSGSSISKCSRLSLLLLLATTIFPVLLFP